MLLGPRRRLGRRRDGPAARQRGERQAAHLVPEPKATGSGLAERRPSLRSTDVQETKKEAAEPECRGRECVARFSDTFPKHFTVLILFLTEDTA